MEGKDSEEEGVRFHRGNIKVERKEQNKCLVVESEKKTQRAQRNEGDNHREIN